MIHQFNRNIIAGLQVITFTACCSGSLQTRDRGPRGPWRFKWTDKPTWSPTWHAMDYVSWSTGLCIKPTSKSGSYTNAYTEYALELQWIKKRGAWPFVHTSCFPLIRLRYQSIEKRREREAGADSKSASFSNKGTTRKGLAMRHSRCKSSTARTSDGAVAIEMT